MSILRPASLSLFVLLMMLLAAPATAQEQSPQSLWEDFNHYVRIARPDLAGASATALLAAADDQTLLDVVEGSTVYRDWERSIERAKRIETLQPVATELENRIQGARITRSRDSDRIKADITRLAEGQRARMNAIERLRSAGQFAAPHLLATLVDSNQKQLHPYVVSAMVTLGRPMVNPLSAAITKIEPVPQAQIAQVLAEIGYPEALPYLKHVIENADTDPAARQSVQSAYNQLAGASNVSQSASAAELFLSLGHKFYTIATGDESVNGYDQSTDSGIVWEYSRETGLVAVPVPGQIFGDVMAMRASRHSLMLDPTSDSALSLNLMSNLRRENRLLDGQEDPSYPQEMAPPTFYAEAAGPLRQHDVLQQALNDGDTKLALDAIAALNSTGGIDAQVNSHGAIQPLLRALSYPDRRVRFNAAYTIANARPSAHFASAHRVVPVLAEAVRQSDSRFVLVLASNQDDVNKLMAGLSELGLQGVGGTSFDQVADQINALPGIDLIITMLPAQAVTDLHRQTSTIYKLASAPILALASPADESQLRASHADDSRIHLAAATTDASQLRQAVDAAAGSFAGQAIEASDAEAFALQALGHLRLIAQGTAKALTIDDATPALLAALSDKRQTVVTQASQVLAVIKSDAAQRAIADAALDSTRPARTREALLVSLAESARIHGNLLEQHQIDALLELVKTNRTRVGIAAAKAHGALALPTSNVVEMLVQ